jgi:hypothetical protein
MIKSKPCTVDDCSNPRFAKGFCKYHQQLRTDKKKPKNYISPVSNKKLKELKIYRKNRLVYLKEHPKCEVCGINKADQIHHKAGRVGDDLTDPKNFLAVDDKCHVRIELNPIWAKDNGYSVNRL